MSSHGSLRDEILQTRPFRSASHEAVLGLFRTTDLLRRFFARRMESCGLTLQQYNVLRILRGAGVDGLPTLAIAERVVEQTPGITRLVDRLEAKGLVSRTRDAEDRRCVRCRITVEGLALMAELDPLIEEADERSLAMLGLEEQRVLIRLLDRVREAHS